MNEHDIEQAVKYLKNCELLVELDRRNGKTETKRRYVKSIEAVIEYIEKQLTGGWIPVTERLPTDSQTMHYRGKFIVSTAWGVTIAIYNRITKRWEDGHGHVIVLAWMPMPEPYKESEEK